MRRHSLTDLLVHYKNTGEGKQELIDQSAVYIHILARRKPDWDEDDASEFVCHFLPKIPALIDRFVYCGKPFEAYLIAHVKWSVRSFAVRLKRRRWTEELYSREELWEIREEDPAYLPEPPLPPPCLQNHEAHTGNSVSPVWRQRLLLLCLRECGYLSGLLLERIAVILEVDRDWLLNCVQELRHVREEELRRMQVSIELRNASFVRLQLLEWELEYCETAERREEVEKKILQERMLLEQRNIRLLRHRVRPTNRDISRVLGMPKGSVDSSFHYLFHRLPLLLQEYEDAA